MSEAQKPFKASDMYRQMVGPQALLTDPYVRTIYNTLLSYERHHAEKHADCEERTKAAVEDAVDAIARSGEQPPEAH